MHIQTQCRVVRARIPLSNLVLVLIGSFIFLGCGQTVVTDRPLLPGSVIETSNDHYSLVATPSEAADGTWLFTAKPRPSASFLPARFEWDFGDGETVAGETVAHVFPGPGSYVVTLTAYDAHEQLVFVLALDMEIPAFNRRPVVDAGGSQTVYSGDRVVLDGSASSDADGDELSFSWAQLSGAPVILSDALLPRATFLAPAVDESDRLVFVLTVSDGDHVVEQSVTVDVLEDLNPSELALLSDAGADRRVQGGQYVALDGSSSSALEGSVLTFKWRQVSGTPVALTDASAAVSGFTAPPGTGTAQVLVFELTVSDGELVDVDGVAITVVPEGDVVPIPCATDEVCDDGKFCNGSEACVSGYCAAGNYPCSGAMCDEPTSTCFPEVRFELENQDGQRPLTVTAAAVTVGGGPLPDGSYVWFVDAVEADEGPVANHVLTSGGAHSVALAFTLLGSTVTIACKSLDTGSVAAKVYVWPSISGSVRDESGQGVSGATVAANAGGTTTVTDAAGDFVLHVPHDWSGTITAQHSSYEVTPTQRVYEAVREDVTGQSFTASTQDGGEPPPECTESSDCTDGLFCNGAEACLGGSCVAGSDPCNGQPCDEELDECITGCTVDAACDDGLFCNGAETCSEGSCLPGVDPCPGQLCDESRDACAECLAHADCDDGVFCTGMETCAAGACVAGVDPCPGSHCDETSDVCAECLVDAHCNDGVFCNGVELCADGACSSGSAPCAGLRCDETHDACVECIVDGDCVDALFCNGAESCSNGTCVSGSHPCPGLGCDEVRDRCVGCLSDGECDDGLYCNGLETCAGGTCQEGADPCPGQECDEDCDACVECLTDAHCDDGVFCNGAEVCVEGSCLAGAEPCPERYCDAGSDSCVDCLINAHCSDGAFCNGAELCDAGSCQVGLEPCPGRLCDERGDLCVDCLIDTDCDDGAFCSGVERCWDGTCGSGNDPCPGQYCDEFADSCADCLSDAHCSDGVFCNGAEVCLNGACLPGADPCPDQRCRETDDTCVDCLIDADCDDGAYCNGVEVCSGGACQSGVEPCPDQVCDEATDACVSCATSAVAWQNHAIASQGGLFTVEFDAIPEDPSMDGLTTLSSGEAEAFSDLAVGVRFNLVDVIDVRNGASYGADTVLTYAPGTSYHFRIDVNVPSHTYSVHVTPQGSPEITLATDYAFRTEQSGVASLDHWGMQADVGTHHVCNFMVTPGPNLPPQALSDAYSVEPEGALDVAAPGVLRNDRDPEGDALTAVLVGDVSNGDLAFQADGSFVYSPDPGFSGSDSFTYQADDGVNRSGTTGVTITVGTPTWAAPVGIPVPDFGIEGSHEMYAGAHFAAGGFDYRDAGNGPYTHYVDNSAPGNTDSGNPYGTPALPRRTIPANLPAGSVVEVHGGPYTDSTSIRLTGVGTADQPIFVRGAHALDRPLFPGPAMSVTGQYFIVENLLMNGTGAGFHVTAAAGSTNHHIAFRHSEILNSTGGAAVSTAGYINSPDALVHNIVIYNNDIHDMGDWQAPNQWDRNCVGVLKNSRYIWVIDNELHHNQGDGVAVNWWGHGDQQVPPQFVYIGRNHIHHNQENALDFKCPRDVVVSENRIHSIRATADGSGQGDSVVVHNDDATAAFPYPDSIWFLYNEFYDVEIGITCNSIHDFGVAPSRTYIIGNVFHDIMAYSSPLRANNIWSPGVALRVLNRAQVTAANNTVHRCDLGFVGGNVRAELHTVGNIITDLTDNYYSTFGSQPYQLIVSSAASAAASRMHHNLLWQGGDSVRIGWGGSTYTGIAAFQAVTGAGAGSMDDRAPDLVDATGQDGDPDNDFDLAAGSPCVDAGYYFAGCPIEGLVRCRDDAVSEGVPERAALVERIMSDLQQTQPPTDEPDAANSGTGTDGINYCDIGAFERQPD
jgi:hypothetical protein